MPQRLIPFLGYEDAAAAIDWLCAAFGAVEDAEARQTDGSGTVIHAELDLEGSTIFLSTPAGYVSSRRHRESCETERASTSARLKPRVSSSSPQSTQRSERSSRSPFDFLIFELDIIPLL